MDEDDNDKFRLERVKPVGTSRGYIWDLGLITYEITMTLSINLVSARVRQQFIEVVNGLHGDGEV